MILLPEYFKYPPRYELGGDELASVVQMLERVSGRTWPFTAWTMRRSDYRCSVQKLRCAVQMLVDVLIHNSQGF